MVVKKNYILFSFAVLLGTVITATSLPHAYSAQVESVNVPANSVYTLTINMGNGARFEGSLSITGGSGNDINFWVTDPAGNQVISKRLVQSGGDFEFTATRDGAYTLNLDNSFSAFSSKVVTVSYDVHNPILPSSGGSGGGGCLIATAAFGSELTPQVQFLRNFRDTHVLATSSGSSFMSAFNVWYYSFSPQVADYEREQPWLQETVKIAIYPLLAILQVAEKAYAIVPGEYGSVAAGMVASSLIGAVYVTPMAISIRRIRHRGIDYRIAAIVIIGAAALVFLTLLIANETLLTITASVLVLSTLVISSIVTASVISRLLRKKHQEL